MALYTISEDIEIVVPEGAYVQNRGTGTVEMCPPGEDHGLIIPAFNQAVLVAEGGTFTFKPRQNPTAIIGVYVL
ncbi:hypothetical protein [Paracoccus onubensis]|uniref:Uncharacterized protein n=1 Tax=Paracoccus onubensis TaxID=1675788 RepID=A0A418SZP9_9RHOB|nr:hypothetical protein [Paracoccus onubensis]RJE86396.1 hypothetical protein D3P04_06585 [Paracoccus onubensis]